MYGSTCLVKTLERCGVKHVFGIPGDVPYALGAFVESSIKFIPTRHEQVAGFMADVYGRFSELPGVCYGSLGPGATNLVTAVANSFQDRSAVVVLIDQIATTDFHKNFHQYIPIEKIFEPITKETILVRRAADIDFNVEYAFEIAKKEKCGPVALIFPEDVLHSQIPEEKYRRRVKHKKLESVTDISAIQLEEVSSSIKEATFGIVIVGEELSRAHAEEELQAFIERYNFPVFTTFMAKGTISEDHPLSLGTISRHFESVFEPLFHDADLIITIGYDYIEGIRPTFWEKGRQKKIICVDSVPNAVPEFYSPDTEIVTDIKLFLRALGKPETSDARKQNINFNLHELKKNKDSAFRNQSKENQTICGFIDVLSSTLNADDIVVSDVGLHKQFMGLTYNARQARRVIFSNGFSSMGFSLPGAMAAKLLNPDKTVVAVCGDGGFLMNMQDLETCRRLSLPIIIVLLNDNSYGLIRWKQQKTFQSNIGVTFTNPDFMRVAEAFGLEFARVTDTIAFQKELEKATSRNLATIIEIPILYNYDQK